MAFPVFDYVFRHSDFLPAINHLDTCLPLIRSLGRYAIKIQPHAAHTRSAVLLPLFPRNGQTHILFIRRSDQVRYHKGEIAFPGGQSDPDDPSPAETAIRETFEETGMVPDRIRIWTELDDLITPYDFHVTPFVGTLDAPLTFSRNPTEVSEIIEIPLSCFFQREIYRSGFRLHQNTLYPIHSFYCYERRVWGITGKIIWNLIHALVRAHAEEKGNIFQKSS